MTARRALALTLTTWALAFPARAQSEAVVLDYEAPKACPTRARFIEEVRALTEKADFVDGKASERRFRVSVTRLRGSVNGKLVIDAQGEHSEREVSGTTCGEVVSALALATAIAVDPGVLGGEPTPPPDPAPPEGKPTPPPPATTAESKPVQADRPPRRAPEQPAPPLESTVLLALGAGVMTAIAPEPSPLTLLRVGFRPAGELAPELFVEGARALPTEGDSASFSAWLARSGVTFEFVDVGLGSLGVMAAGELGSLTATGADEIVGRRTEERLWATLDAGLSLTVPAPRPVFVRLETAAFLTLLRHEYEVLSVLNEPEVVHTIPHAGLRASVLVGFFL